MPSSTDLAVADANASAAIYAAAQAAAGVGGAGPSITIGQRSIGLTSITNATLLTAAPTRVVYMVRNDSNVDVLVRRGSLAVSLTNYSFKVPAGGTERWDAVWKGQVQYLLTGAPTGDITVEELLP